jgi:hypothetical protein
MHPRPLCVGILFAAAALALGPERAQAKVVGLVFDDSGSMVHTYHLPLFGAQILAASLDGRPSQDRFFVVRLSAFRERFENGNRARNNNDYVPILPGGLRSAEAGPDNVGRIVASAPDLVERMDIAPGEPLRRVIDRIRRWPIISSTPTPYEPVEMMLDKLASETTAGEDAHLVIMSDGSFYDDVPGMMPSAERLRANYREWQRRIKGRLTVHFLLIKNGATEANRRLLETQVARQGVISGLLQTFGPESRSYSVDGFEDLRNAMIEIIARVSATDRDRSSAIVRRPGDNTIELNVPFSVSKIITAGIAQLPQRAARSVVIEGVTPAGRTDSEAMMASADNYSRWPAGVRLVGDVSQFLFDEALPRGRHIIRFESQVGTNVEVLFRSDISLGWSLREASGTTLFRSRDREQGAAGTATARIGRLMRLDVDVFDRLAKQMADLSSFPSDAILELLVREPDGRDRAPQRLVLAPDRSAFTGPITFARTGAHAIRVRMRLPGFVTTESAAVTVNADDRAVDFDIAVAPDGAAGRDYRRDGEVNVLTPDAGRAPEKLLGRVVITPREGPAKGDLDLKVTGLPTGLEARVGGKVIPADGQHHEFRSQQPIAVELFRTPAFTGIARGAVERGEINVSAIARAPQEGTATAMLRVDPVIGPPVVKFEGADAAIELVELQKGQRSLQMKIIDPLVEGAVPEKAIEVTPSAITNLRWIDIARTAVGSTVQITPSAAFPRWPACCIIGLFGLGEYGLDVSYRRQDKVALIEQASFRVEDRAGWTRWYCVVSLLLVGLLFYFLGFLAYRLTAVNFPKKASLMFERDASGMPDREPLRHSFSWTSLKALAWPYYLMMRKRIRQRFARSELDLIFEAVTRDAAQIRPKGDQWPPFTLKGQLLSMQGGGEDGRPIEPLEMDYGEPYGDSLVEQRQNGLVVTLVKNYQEFPGFWPRFRRKR